jgi:hypothetical protein
MCFGLEKYIQHSVRLVPTQMRLDIYGRFGLNAETDQADHKEETRIDISLPRCICSKHLWISLLECALPPSRSLSVKAVYRVCLSGGIVLAFGLQ